MMSFIGFGVGVAALTLASLAIYMFLKLLERLDNDSRFRMVQLGFENPSSFETTPAPSLFDEPTKSLSIVIPAYNEEDRLPGTLQETMAYLQRRRDLQGANFTYEVIIVDDGSKDQTVAKAQSFVHRYGFDAVRVLRLPSNRGKGYAVKAGVLCCRGREILFMDADGATRVSELEKLEERMKKLIDEGFKAMESRNYVEKKLSEKDEIVQQRINDQTTKPNIAKHFGKIDDPNLVFVLGSRAHLQNSTMAKRTWIRNFLMHGFHFLVTMVVGHEIKDTQCGFKLMSRPAARILIPNQRLQRWAFDVELVQLAQKLGIRMAEIQVSWTEIPGSKVRLTSIAHIAFELALIKIAYGLGIWQFWNLSEINKRNT